MAGEREAASDVQQPIADSLGFGLGQVPVEGECLGPDEQVVREHHDLKPHLVERERLARELGQAGVRAAPDRTLRRSKDLQPADGTGYPRGGAAGERREERG